MGVISVLGTGATPSCDSGLYYNPPEFNWVTSSETANEYIYETKERISKKAQVCLRPRDRFWDIPVPKIDSAFDNLLVPQPSWSPSTTQQLRKLVAAPYLSPNDWTPRLDAYFAFPLALCARRVSSAASRLLGATSFRFALHGWQRMYGITVPFKREPAVCLKRIPNRLCGTAEMTITRLKAAAWYYPQSVLATLGLFWLVIEPIIGLTGESIHLTYWQLFGWSAGLGVIGW